MTKIQNIQALRGIAVLSVTLYHLSIIEQKYGGSISILPKLLQFGMFGVDLFFIISGFVMITITRGKFQNQQQALKFIYHRIARIYPSYWVYSLLVLGVFLIQPTWVNSTQENQVDIMASFLLVPANTLPLVMVGWTLIHEMYFYLIFFILLLISAEKNIMATLIIWTAIVIILNTFVLLNNPVFKIISHPLTIEFIAGCIFAVVFYQKNIRFRVPILLVMAALTLALSIYGFYLYQNITEQIDPTNWWRVLVFGTPALLIVFCFIYAEKSGYILPSALIKIGDASYSIYLSHILTLSATGRVWAMFATDSISDNIIMLPVLLIIVLIVGIISYHLIEKPLLKLSHRIA
ncbi:MAG: exopolysaccharide production protein ExoZ [Methyloprofundus sp.]|nr:MAG: exopolysaccharide production protein ExoZ [Methyloprofundus sp.]